MKKTCEACGGSGQTGHFQGVSRFIITWDECFECNGTGSVEIIEKSPRDQQTKRVKKYKK